MHSTARCSVLKRPRQPGVPHWAQAAGRPRPCRTQRLVTKAITVRPYTVRKDDTLQSIAEKRGARPRWGRASRPVALGRSGA